MLITQALAQIKLIGSKVNKDNKEATEYAFRRGDQVDPLAQQGGSTEFVKARLQAIRVNCNTLLDHRKAIRLVNEGTMVTIEGETRSIADWLAWKREVAPVMQNVLSGILRIVATARTKAAAKPTPDSPEPIISHLNEKILMEELSKINTTMAQLDATLSVHNATTNL